MNDGTVLIAFLTDEGTLKFGCSHNENSTFTMGDPICFTCKNKVVEKIESLFKN